MLPLTANCLIKTDHSGDYALIRNLGSAVPEIIANRIIAVAKNGERDPARLYEQALKVFGIDDTSMLVVSVGRDPPVPAYASVTQAA